jgi:Clostridial hydrophobic W
MSDAAAAVLHPANAPHDARPAAPADAPATGAAAGRVAELRVSGNLMTLDTGLFCVFPVPGSPPPDPATGLPGVRVSLAPGVSARTDSVHISTFREDGWLDGTAALVRVTEGPAQVLVTIYQNPLQSRDAAPRLQVMRLDGPTPAPAPAARPPAPQARPVVADAPEPEATAHVQSTGDVGGWIGTRGSRLWIEGFGISPHSLIAPADIEYQAVLGRGWLSPWVEGGKFCGSRGMALPLLGLKLRLRGEAANQYECTYSATFVDGSSAGPVPAGESCEAESLAALEAFQIEFHPQANQKAEAVKAPLPRPVRAKTPVRGKGRAA